MASLAELVQASKDYIKGTVLGNTVDALGAPVDLATIPINTALKLAGKKPIEQPLYGSKYFRNLVGADVEDKNIAQTAGSTVSIGGAVKAIASADKTLAIIGAALYLKTPAELDKFSELEKLGTVSAKEIFNQTGIYRGPIDNKLRAVISDEGAKFGDKKVITHNTETKDLVTGKWKESEHFSLVPGSTQPLNEVLDHPRFIDIYGDMGIKVQTTSDPLKSVGGAYYDPGTKTITMNSAESPEALLSILLHETQHAVQNYEGFARGGNQAEFFKDRNRFLTAVDVLKHKEEKLRDLLNKSLPAGVTVDSVLKTPENYREFAKLPQFGELKSLRTQAAVLNQGSKEGYENYMRIAGEAEARAVQTMFESKASGFPIDMYDRNPANLIDPATKSSFPKVDENLDLNSVISELLAPAFK